jgi:hypothetical protein
LQRELEVLRTQLSHKDKIVTELQRQVNKSDTAQQKTAQALASCQQELKHRQQDCERIRISKQQVERSLQTQQELTQKMESEHKHYVNMLEGKLQQQADKIADLEKANRALQNEKAVLGAAVEARESKLVKLGELQSANQTLRQQVAQQSNLEAKLQESQNKYQKLKQEMQAKSQAEEKCQTELANALTEISELKVCIQRKQEQESSYQSQLDLLQKTNQQLKGERNNYKQKNDSLTKEISRLCRNGHSICTIEKMLADHEALTQEVELLRVQKRKALEDAHKYRTSYEQIKATEQVLGVEQETRQAVERSAELERLLAEMTDYVQAKEMQLDTLKQVNEAMQEEIHNLAKANLRKNEV